MDWKELLSQKIESGELQREDFAADASEQKSSPSLCADTIEVILDKKGRKGKVATLAVGFSCNETKLKEIASLLKSKLSTGGSARGGEILIQGSRVDDMKKALTGLGFKVK